MEMRVEQALQEAVEVHKAGKLKDAAALYSAILQISPKHPDANHNLGVMAASLNKSEVAISHFKVALEANPTQRQFWLSYIDALIIDKQFDQARNILEQGKKRGFTGDKIDTLEKQLASISQNQIKQSILKIKSTTSSKKNKMILSKKEINNITQINLINKKSPPQIEINILLEYYKEGRYNLALDVAKTLTKQYPKYPFVWKVLGALFIRLGRLQESLIAHQKVLEITPNDAELYSNLGITLKKLGRLADAEVNYKKALALKADYTEAHINLGNTLIELGRLDEAETSYKTAIAINPLLSEAHSNLGNVLHKLRRLEEAEASYKKALAINADYTEAHINLGNTLIELGRLEEAETSYKKAIAIKPNSAEAHSNLGATMKELGKLEEAETYYKKAIDIKKDYAQAHTNLGNIMKELGRLEEAETSYKNAITINPDYAEAHSNLGNILQEQDRLTEAEASYARAISLKPDIIKIRCEMMACLYRMDKKKLFFDELDYLIKQNIANSSIGSLTCRSALKYGEEKANIFCNEPLNHVLLVDLKSRYNFEEVFIRNIKSILSKDKRSNRSQLLLSNGYQTSGNLFYKENDVTSEIHKIILIEIEKYRINFESSQEGFVKKWPKEFSLYGWLISMKSGGELHPHIHTKGWLSGSIYINVPPKSKINSGNLVVALGTDSDTTNSQLNPKKILNVVTGVMVLFPASLMHYTIPFESEEDRIVLAFDVVPKYFD
jgi:tetratricopeptide (TPR) repeat protein